MPHDSKGRLIEIGDVVKCLKYGGEKVSKQVGKVSHIYAGTETCNLQVATFESREGFQTVTAKESELVLKADGSEPKEVA